MISILFNHCKLLNEQLTAMLLESDDTDVTRKRTNQSKVLRKSTSAGQHH